MPEPLFPAGRDGSPDAAERALRRTLAAQAAAVRPGAPPRVGELVGATRPRRWPAALGVAAAVGVLAVTSAVALRQDAPPAPVAAPDRTAPAVPGPTPSTSLSEPSAGPSSAPSAEASSGSSAGPTTTPTGGGTATQGGGPPSGPPAGRPEVGTVVVWASVVDPRTGSGRLVPERRPVDLPGSPSTSERVSAALTLLVSSAPADPDHYSGWYWDAEDAGGREPYDGEEPVGVDLRDDGTTVDLPAAATLAPLGSLGNQTALDELVRTVVSNGGAAPVTVLVDGSPVTDLWGAVAVDGPLRADPALLTGGWILDPHEGQRVRAGTVTLSGTATAFEATVAWLVRDEAGATVAEGSTEAGSNGDYGPWTVQVELPPGTYTAVLRAEDVAGADESSGPWLWEHSTAFTVVG